MAEQSAKKTTPAFAHYTLPDGTIFIYVNNVGLPKGEKLWFSKGRDTEKFYLNYKGPNERLKDLDVRKKMFKELISFLRLDPVKATWNEVLEATEKKDGNNTPKQNPKQPPQIKEPEDEMIPF